MFVWISISVKTFWGNPLLVRDNKALWRSGLYKQRKHSESSLWIFATNLGLESTPKHLLVSISSDPIRLWNRPAKLALTLKKLWAPGHRYRGRGILWHVLFRTTYTRADYVLTLLIVFGHQFFNSFMTIERLWVCMRVSCLLDGGSYLCFSIIAVRDRTVYYQTIL